MLLFVSVDMTDSLACIGFMSSAAATKDASAVAFVATIVCAASRSCCLRCYSFRARFFALQLSIAKPVTARKAGVGRCAGVGEMEEGRNEFGPCGELVNFQRI